MKNPRRLALANKIFYPLIISLFIFLAYSNIFQNNFAFDDPTFITGWQETHSFKDSIGLLRGDVPLGHGGLYRPIRSMIYVISYKLWKDQTFGYHFQSIIIIILISVLVYNIILLITGKKFIAVITALLFGLHPVHTEAISFITASFDSIGLFFFFLSFYLYLKQGSVNNRLLYLVSLLTATLAYFTYEMTLTLPILLLLYELCFGSIRRSSYLTLFLKQSIKLVPFAVIAGFYIFVRVYGLEITTRGDYLLGSPYITFLVMLQTIEKYATLLVFPVDLTVNPLIAPKIVALSWAEIHKDVLLALSFWQFNVLKSVVFILSLFSIAIITFKKQPFVAFGIFWFFIALLPILNIIPQGAIMTERYLFISSFGFCFIMASLIYKLFIGQIKKVSIFLLILILAFYSFQTYKRNQDWKTTRTLWSSAYNLNPNSSINATNLAVAYEAEGNKNKTFQYLTKALEISPDNYRTHQNIAVWFFKNGKYDKAIEEYKKSVILAPNISYLYSGLSVAYQKENKLDLAKQASLQAVQLGHDYDPMAYFHLGEIYLKQNKAETAILAFKKALEIDPFNPVVLNNLGIVYYDQNKYGEATKLYLTALKDNPDAPELHFNLGKAYDAMGKYTLALKEYKTTIKLNPNLAKAHNNLGIIYTGLNQPGLAESEFKRAIVLDNQLAEAYFNLGYVYKLNGDLIAAKKIIEEGLKINPNEQKAIELLQEINYL